MKKKKQQVKLKKRSNCYILSINWHFGLNTSPTFKRSIIYSILKLWLGPGSVFAPSRVPKKGHAKNVLSIKSDNLYYHRPLLYHSQSFLAISPMCSASLMIVAGYLCMSESKLPKGQIPLSSQSITSNLYQYPLRLSQNFL